MLLLINKIKLLFITLKALNIYSEKYINEYTKKFINKNFFSFYLKSDNTSHFTVHYYYVSLLIYIQAMYNIINTKTIQNLSQYIMYDYTKNTKSNLLKAYLNKFTYIYYKLYNYYNCNKNKEFNISNIHKLAIINLYIIIKNNKKQGISCLIKYLYKYNIY